MLDGHTYTGRQEEIEWVVESLAQLDAANQPSQESRTMARRVARLAAGELVDRLQILPYHDVSSLEFKSLRKAYATAYAVALLESERTLIRQQNQIAIEKAEGLLL